MKQDEGMKVELPKSTRKKLSKADIVYDFLLNGIIEGSWLPGDRINDKEIAEHLGVNRLAVREALSRLIQNDVIEQEQWKGYHIREITEHDVQSLVEVRISLEELAMRLFLKQHEVVQNQTLELMSNTITDSLAYLEKGDHAKYMEIDFQFHELLYGASGNHMISRIIANTRITTSIMRNLSMGKEFNEFKEAALISSKEHEQILHALEARDLEQAYAALNAHLGNTFVYNILRHIHQKQYSKEA
jgi:DNA-binding GntR family transcriptional regulator